MGERGSCVRTMDGSDESFDLTCSPCVRKNRNREATKYCVDCQDYYCSTCVEFHSDIPALSNHNILGRSEFPTNGSDGLLIVPTDRCSIHGTKLTDMFCQNDDQIGCSICIAVKHRSCIDVIYIPKEINHILKEEEIHKVKKDMKEANTRISELIEARHRDVAELEKDMIVALGVIKDFREQINNTLDELEKTTKREFESKYEEIHAAIKADIAAMNVVVEDMDACKQQLQLAEGNRSQQFVCMKKGQQKLSEADNIGKDVIKYERTITIEVDTSIKQFLNGLSSLGRTIEHSISKSFKVQQHCSLYQVIGRNNHSINESSLSCVHGSCILTNGDILLTLYNRQKMKRFDSSTYKEVDECALPDRPLGVCEISPQEAGVSLQNNTVLIVSLGNKMAQTRSIKTNHFCFGVAFSDGEMFVTAADTDNSVYVYDTSGTLLRTIRNDQSGAEIFAKTRNVSVSGDGSTIYVADVKKGVIAMDKQGVVLWRFSDPELSDVWGVCTDGRGNVLATGYRSNNVVQIGPKGDKLGVIVNDDIVKPVSVCFDRSKYRMIVSVENSKYILVLELG